MSIYSACAPLHTLSMSSREIAALTGKRHDNIMRDIRVMLNELYPDTSELSYQEIQGISPEYCPQTKRLAGYHLDRRHTEILITGYDIKRRAAVIDRWYELESGQAQPRYATPPDPDPLHRPDFIRAYIRLTALNLCLDHLSLNDTTKRQLIEQAVRSLGEDAAFLQTQTPPPPPAGRELTTLSTLLRRHQQRHSVQVVNRALVRLGWLQDIRRETPRGLKRVKQLVGEGLCYGRNQRNQPLYYAVQFPELLRRIGGYLR
ncbi:Rha family transcriptional regulator [Thiorhodospira sibirica]|uniref:Rha family transcriptional regulator n=1 Tax=Thiorhodospira sibirica TaxID=154347 RepID=UPI00022C5DF1|nr:Rha family transcriptional regulator [Thiorhodospira sibirica]